MFNFSPTEEQAAVSAKTKKIMESEMYPAEAE